MSGKMLLHIGGKVAEDRLQDITPEIIAELFCDLGSDEQARFFNHIAEVASTWSAGFPFQLQWVTDDDGLNLSGRRVMQQIGEYSHWGLCTWNRG